MYVTYDLTMPSGFRLYWVAMLTIACLSFRILPCSVSSEEHSGFFRSTDFPFG